MTTDGRALTIVTAFLGTVMMGFWIANACAIYHGDRSIPNPQESGPPVRAEIASTR